jgi:hypothetical protein
MNRKQFLTTLGGCCGLAAIGAEPGACAQAQPPAQGTPCDKKYDFAQTWVKRFMNIMDAELDQATRTRLLRIQGRVCFESGHGSAPAEKPKPGDLNQFLEALRKWGGEEMVHREGDVIHFQYLGNPTGLRVADGWCLCPVVERGPEGLSGTYCECSVGYVTEMFRRHSDRPLKVELLESLKRGGKGCKFRIELA